MLNVAVGHSNDPDSLEAINEVLSQCQEQLAGRTTQAGILFAAIDFDHAAILQRIDQVFPRLELIGGTTDGELSSVLQFQQDSLVLMVFSTEDLEIRAAVGRNVSEDPVAIAQQTVTIAQQFLSTPPKFCITTPESLTTSASSILQGLKSVLGNAPVFGGATADQTHAQQTYQFFKTEVLSDSVPILLFAGNIKFSHGVASGWRPMGNPSQITKVDHNVIYEIDGKPALEFYHYYFDHFAPDAAYPFAVFPPGEERFFLRGPLGHDPEVGSITVSGDVPEGSMIQMTEASSEDILMASKSAYADAWDSYPGDKPTAALFFSCAWRRWIMGTQTHQEYQAIANHQPQPLPACGFYTYGEIAPLRDAGESFFHNTTFATLLIGT
jgi:hypothetical protein